MNMETIMIDLMTRYPDMRTNNRRLVWTIWRTLGFTQKREYERETLSYQNFMLPTFPTSETILRLKRRILASNPHLRNTVTS